MKKFYLSLYFVFVFAANSFGLTVAMKFETSKYIAIMESAIKGEVCFFSDENGNVRWQTISPYESVMLLNSKGVFQFEKQKGKWRKLDSKFGGTVKRIVDEIRKIIVGDFGDSYEVKKIADSVELIPKNSSAKNFISKIKITLKQSTQIPTIIEFVEVSGDRTVMKVVEISQDAKLDASIFDDTKIGDFIYPKK